MNFQFQSAFEAVHAQYDFDENTDRAFREEIEATLWGGIPTAKEHKMDREIAALVARIEACCLPVLRLKADGKSGSGTKPDRWRSRDGTGGSGSE